MSGRCLLVLNSDRAGRTCRCNSSGCLQCSTSRNISVSESACSARSDGPHLWSVGAQGRCFVQPGRPQGWSSCLVPPVSPNEQMCARARLAGEEEETQVLQEPCLPKPHISQGPCPSLSFLPLQVCSLLALLPSHPIPSHHLSFPLPELRDLETIVPALTQEWVPALSPSGIAWGCSWSPGEMPWLNAVFLSSKKNNEKRGPFLRGRSCPQERQKKQGPSPSQVLPAEVWCSQGAGARTDDGQRPKTDPAFPCPLG